MSSTLLTLIQDFCRKKGLTVPAGVVGNTELTTSQLLALMHEVVEDALLYPWQEQKQRVTWTTVAASDQGALASLFGAGYYRLSPGSLWNNTLNRPINGPLTDTEWQVLQAASGLGPVEQFKIMGGHLYILPVPPAGHTCSAMVETQYAVFGGGTTPQARIQGDSDTFVFPDNYAKADLEWRWLKEQKEPWLAAWERMRGILTSILGKDASQPTLHLDGPQDRSVRPGIVVPAGSWNV